VDESHHHEAAGGTSARSFDLLLQALGEGQLSMHHHDGGDPVFHIQKAFRKLDICMRPADVGT
jgi:hypothetical protein